MLQKEASRCLEYCLFFSQVLSQLYCSINILHPELQFSYSLFPPLALRVLSCEIEILGTMERQVRSLPWNREGKEGSTSASPFGKEAADTESPHGNGRSRPTCVLDRTTEKLFLVVSEKI